MNDRPEYPLRFEYREFARIQRNDFERITVLELLEKILLRYGADELHSLLKGAAKAIVERLGKHPEELALRDDVHFYQHGQILLSKSTKQTPAECPTPSVQDTLLDG